MTLFPVDVEMDYEDAAERTATITYRLALRFDDTAAAGVGNWAAVLSDADDLFTALSALSMAQLKAYRVKMNVITGALSANIAANNQVRAFTRVVLANGDKGSMVVPAWDDVVYDEDSNNLLSDVYNIAALIAADLLEDPDSGSDFASVSYTQSHTHKSRNVLND